MDASDEDCHDTELSHTHEGMASNNLLTVMDTKPTSVKLVDREAQTSCWSSPSSMSNVVSVNVGGQIFTTRLATLCQYEDTMLATMFSGRHNMDKDAQGNYFIDRSGEYFKYILEFLRIESLPPASLSVRVYDEACYYNIGPLIDKLRLCPAVARLVVADSHRAQFPDYKHLRENIIKAALEEAAANKEGEVHIHAVKTKLKPDELHGGTCVANDAHVSVGPWDGRLADAVTLIQCLVDDFEEEGFVIKPQGSRRVTCHRICRNIVFKITFVFH